MNTSGEAADQVLRMSLEVGEAALKISGTGAKQLAVLLYAILKEQKKTSGRTRMENLVRSGKPLTVFSIKESDLKKFVEEAKHYGVLYCAVRDPKGSSDGMVDIMVKEEDAPRINRIVERFKFAAVTESARIKTEIEQSREAKSQADAKEPAAPEKQKPEKSKEDRLVDELMAGPIQKDNSQKSPKNGEKDLVFTGKERSASPSVPISGKRENATRPSFEVGGESSPLVTAGESDRPSVREELKEIKKARQPDGEKKKDRSNEKDKSAKPAGGKEISHKQPEVRKKVDKAKER